MSPNFVGVPCSSCDVSFVDWLQGMFYKQSVVCLVPTGCKEVIGCKMYLLGFSPHLIGKQVDYGCTQQTHRLRCKNGYAAEP